MKQAIKQLMHQISPQALTLIQASRLRLGFRRQFSERQRCSRQKIYGGDGELAVLSGPFKGMRYLDETVWGPIEPKWIGCYEEQLHEVIDDVIEANYLTIFDIGSAEGYYAVGLA